MISLPIQGWRWEGTGILPLRSMSEIYSHSLLIPWQSFVSTTGSIVKPRRSDHIGYVLSIATRLLSAIETCGNLMSRI